ncbi:uncharacterized protein LOC113360012 [Papaver somniferum]|uniref:uncharacterized protein LOC113360012 n=1 Tax=Papaver somniferum TaxID=3469 RepID=UPI000E6F8F9A|nr:uncharacterized protein LOC113360012 [Papaver somniferum]
MVSHCQHLHITLSILKSHSLFVKRSKCSFGQSQIEFLGYVINSKGVSADPAKIECTVNWPRPTTTKGLRGFLGLIGYYRKLVKDYGLIFQPLTILLKKGNFSWNTVAESAFELLKKVVTSTPMLVLPDFSKEFVVETDASDTGVRAVLMQEGRHVAF